MQVPNTTAVLVGVVVILAVILVALVLTAYRRRRERDFEVRPLPGDRAQEYRQRLDELERLFVSKPREAVAAARQLVDEMLALMGYPARLRPADRARDLAFWDREHARGYRAAASVDESSTTEEMRRALKQLLDVGRRLTSEALERGPVDRATPAAEPPPPTGAAPAGRTTATSGNREVDEAPAERGAGERRLV